MTRNFSVVSYPRVEKCSIDLVIESGEDAGINKMLWQGLAKIHHSRVVRAFE